MRCYVFHITYQKFASFQNNHPFHSVDCKCYDVMIHLNSFLSLFITESAFGGLDANGLSNDTWTSYLLNQQDRLQNQQTIPKLPSTCCIFTVNPYEPTTTEIPISSEIPGGGGEHFRSRSHHKGRGNGGSTNRDRWNDPRNQIPTPGGYYQQPQQLKGSFQNSNYNNNNYHYNNQNKNNPTVSYRDNDINSMNSYNYNNNDSSLQTSSFMSNNLVISDLRQSTLTDQISGLPASAMGYYAPGAQAPQPMSGGTYHNRRKVALASKKQGEERRWGSRGSFTTTEGPPAGRPSPATIGVCVLPSHLRQQYASSASSSNSGESGSNSFEDSSEMYSTTSIPPPHVTSSPSTITTITPKTEPPTLTSSTPASTEQPSSSPPSTSVPLSSPRSTHPKFNGGSHSSSGNNGQHNRHHHHSTPFTVGMEQHMDGCGDKVLEWVEHSSDVLFVIGFCIIVFLKGCFIAILRYEIKEMIEKIKLLNGEDAGRTAAMNELIGLTSMYETGNDDNGEREGLMSGVHNGNQDTSTNVDGVDADNGSGGAAVASTGCEATRKDSGPYIKENHLIGNNVGPPRFIGNHVGTTGSVDTTNKEDYPRVLGVGRNSVTGGAGEEDFNDSKSSLFGQKPCDGPPLLGNSKHYLQFHHHHLHRNENGGRSVPRNGNNNNSGGTGTGEPLPLTSFENPNVGVPTSASAPSIPSDAMARVTNAPIH